MNLEDLGFVVRQTVEEETVEAAEDVQAALTA